MVRKSSRKNVDPVKAAKFEKVAINFYEGAKLAYEFEYFNAAGVLLIHAAIALADSVTIKRLSSTCSGDNHYEVIKLLQEATLNDNDSGRHILHLEKLIDHKNLVSYSGDIYTKKDIDKLIKHYERFYNWINSLN